MANIDAAFIKQIFNVAKRKKKSDLHYHSQAGDLRRCLEIAEGVMILHPKTLGKCYDLVKVGFPLTMPK